MPCPVCMNPASEILKPELYEWITKQPLKTRKAIQKRIIVLVSATLGPFFAKLDLQRHLEVLLDPEAPKEFCPQCGQDTVLLLDGKVCARCLAGFKPRNERMFAGALGDSLDKLLDELYSEEEPTNEENISNTRRSDNDQRTD